MVRGNGAAMRVSAVGWFLDTLDETERVAAISAAITHNHPEGIKGARYCRCYLDGQKWKNQGGDSRVH